MDGNERLDEYDQFALSKIIGGQVTTNPATLSASRSEELFDIPTTTHDNAVITHSQANTVAWATSDASADSNSSSVPEWYTVPPSVVEVDSGSGNVTVSEPRLSQGASKLYEYLCNVSEGVKQAIVARDFGVTATTVHRWSTELEDMGLITHNGKLEVKRGE